MSTTIYHNPCCTKSRAVLQLLSEKNIDFNVVEYLKTPPSEIELTEILNKLKLQPQDLMRKFEKEYQTSGLNNPNLTKIEQIRLMVANPKVIERPIVVTDTVAAIGRPPENILALF